MQNAEIVVVGAGAAGLMAAIAAARAAPRLRVVALDGAPRLGAKILIAGGGRCNVTHHRVEAADFNGSTTPAIRRVLRAFDVSDTVRFFADAGVQLKQEETGKLFPVSDRARDVLQALTGAARRAGVHLHHPCRVTAIARDQDGFVLGTSTGPWHACAVVVATGGCSVPRTGSDGAGLALLRNLGLPVTPAIFPALVPLTLPDGHMLRQLSGIATEVILTVVSGTGRHLRQVSGSLLCTHQGVSGPAVLDVSRHWQAVRLEDPATGLLVQWLPGVEPEALDASLQQLGGRPVRRALLPRLPDRLTDALCGSAGIDPNHPAATLPRDARRRLVNACTRYPLPVAGTRGFAVAEVTAGGIPLAALTAALEARECPGLFLCGEVCDVDGRIGGFNFQWAWASGVVAGRGASGHALTRCSAPVSG